MDNERKILIWELDAAILAETAENLQRAMHATGCRYDLQVMSEAPLISRAGFYGKTPVLEIDGMFWSLTPGRALRQDELERLLLALEKRTPTP